MNIKFPWFVFDVESVGLFGDPFAVGWAVFTEDYVIEKNWLGFDYNSVRGSNLESFDWCEKNIPDVVKKGNLNSPHFMYEDFARNLNYWQNHKASIICDCPFPVESNFLLKLFKEYAKLCESPYPIYDVASVLAAYGKDPMELYPREPHETVHHPMWDSVVSGKQLFAEYSKTKEMK